MKGFTLLELLVVVAIVSILIVLSIPQFSKFNNSQAVQTSALELQTAVRTAQSNAGSGIKCDSPPTTPSLDWQLLLSDDRGYRVTSTCNPSGSAVNNTFLLSPNVKFSEVSMRGPDELCNESRAAYFTGYGVSYNNVSASAAFKKPAGSVCNDVDFARVTNMVISLRSANDSSVIRKVVIEKSGAVYIDSSP